MSIGPGTLLERFRLVEKIGEGGMGVVWSAIDTSLDRRVAIKVLPERLAQDGEGLARFEREGKVLAALSHPNIAAIHGLHTADTVRFLSMELVPGEDVAARLARGALPCEEALRIAVQIAAALESAHESGIVHRDLKPANVKLTPEGRVKVLDFGLAKAFAGEAAAHAGVLTHSPTITSMGTSTGVILGTAAYMSPEQAKGKAVDRRTDVWAFGVMLHEMLVGRSLFQGETLSETLAAVIMKELRWDDLPASTPPRIRRLLRRCLQRDPHSRLRDIGDARLVIEETLAGADRDEVATAGAAATGTASPRRVWALAAATFAGGLVLGLAAAWALRPAPAPSAVPVSFELRAPLLGAGAISPEGQRVVYVADDRLWVRDLDRVEPRELASTEGAASPFWSPDGAWIGYGANGLMWKVAVAGGRPVQICQLPEAQWAGAAGAAWLADGSIVFTTGGSSLLQVNDRGGDASPYLDRDPETERDFHDASPLPDGRGILFVSHGIGAEAALALSVVAGGERKSVLTLDKQWIRDPVYSPSGHLLFERDEPNLGVWAVPFDLDTLSIQAEPFLVAADAGGPSVSADGTLVYRMGQASRSRQLVQYDRTGARRTVIGEPQEIRPFPALSPDGSRMALVVRDHGDYDVWILDLERGTRTRSTSSGEVYWVAWAPDGRKIAYSAGADFMVAKIYVTAADGSGEPETLVQGNGPSFSSDGRYLVYSSSADGADADLFYLDLDGAREPVRFASIPKGQYLPRLSPDGRHIAYGSSESGSGEVYIRSFPGGADRVQVSVDGGDTPAWSKAGDRLYYSKGDAIFEVSVAPDLRLGRPKRLFERKPSAAGLRTGWSPGFAVSGDGESIYAVESNDAQTDGALRVVLNWFEGFRR